MLKLTLVEELWALSSSADNLDNCLSTCFDLGWQYNTKERPTNILATLPWLLSCTKSLCAKTYPGGEVVSAVIFILFFWPPLLVQLEQHVIMWCALIEMSCKLPAHNYKDSLWKYKMVNANWICPARSDCKTCYQECGCHLVCVWWMKSSVWEAGLMHVFHT